MNGYSFTVGATATEAVGNIFWAIIGISVVLLALVTGLMIGFAVKYNRKRHPRPEPVQAKTWLEVVWTVIPTILVLGMFFYGYEGFLLMRATPEDAMKINVLGRMWSWSFEYENGKRSDKLYVPIGRNIKLNLKSVDVIHSFFMPAFRIKEDVVPGRDTYLWFKPQTVGASDIFCAEYCGQRHAYMLTQVIVMPDGEFTKWYEKDMKTPEALHDTPPPPHRGVKLMEKHGCLSCHTLKGPNGELIPLNGLMGMEKQVLSGGVEKRIVVDEAYLIRSVRQPNAEIVKGQAPMMEAPENMTDEELNVIIEALKESK